MVVYMNIECLIIPNWFLICYIWKHQEYKGINTLLLFQFNILYILSIQLDSGIWPKACTVSILTDFKGAWEKNVKCKTCHSFSVTLKSWLKNSVTIWKLNRDYISKFAVIITNLTYLQECLIMCSIPNWIKSA